MLHERALIIGFWGVKYIFISSPQVILSIKEGIQKGYSVGLIDKSLF